VGDRHYHAGWHDHWVTAAKAAVKSKMALHGLTKMEATRFVFDKFTDWSNS
jgi:hypothetical protein